MAFGIRLAWCNICWVNVIHHLISVITLIILFSDMMPKNIDISKTYSYSNINGAVNKENKFEQAGRFLLITLVFTFIFCIICYIPIMLALSQTNP